MRNTSKGGNRDMISKLITASKSKIRVVGAVLRAFLASFLFVVRTADYRGMAQRVKEVAARFGYAVYRLSARIIYTLGNTDYRGKVVLVTEKCKFAYAKAFDLFVFVKDKLVSLEKRTVIVLSSATAGGAIAILFAIVFLGSQVIGVQVNGKVIGYVSNEAEYSALVEEAKSTLSQDNSNTEIIIEDTKVALSAEYVAKPAAEDKVDEEALIEALTENDAVKAVAYNITVEGEPIVTVGTKKDANSVIKDIAKKFKSGEEGWSGKFQETIGIESVDTELEDITQAASALDYILTGGIEEKTYEVVSGDTVSGIAEKFAVDDDELKETNPGLAEDNIHVGDQVKVAAAKPYVHYETTGQATVRVAIPFETVEEKTDELFVGQTKTKTDGVNGEREVVQDEVRINGVLQSATELSSVTITEPISRVVSVGTKAKYAPGGSWSGAIVGGSGSMSSPLGIWNLSRGVGADHKGLDLLAPYGTTIMAADGGTVTFAGWSGGYGNLIKISHGGGIETYYAHCSSISVSPGQVVGKGQAIGAVGATGWATGNHVHFEVRVNGVYSNPLGWL
ncbi:MAG: peptidoglycan DD-metalloendopeptidase family protein [Clostridiales Family XIII bacterium]|nr:peptidoglycan DD-metalloendopeptidase family protein [Clostridiales Family XIII bacterium]